MDTIDTKCMNCPLGYTCDQDDLMAVQMKCNFILLKFRLFEIGDVLCGTYCPVSLPRCRDKAQMPKGLFLSGQGM